MTVSVQQNAGGTKEQYSLAKTLSIWAAAAAPMAILGWLVAPWLTSALNADMLTAAVIRMGCLTSGLVWQFVLSLIVVRRERGNLRWATLRDRFWLNAPRQPKTGERNRKLWLWLLPIAALLVVMEMFISPALNGPWVRLFPFFAEPPSFSFGVALQSPELQAQVLGKWWFFGLTLLMAVFNTVLGEEFLFRGVLLPKMEGRFGKWDWLANGVLMGAYHWHQPWGIPGNIVVGAIFFALPARRFRSSWMPIIAHSLQYALPLFLILGLVTGMA